MLPVRIPVGSRRSHENEVETSQELQVAQKGGQFARGQGPASEASWRPQPEEAKAPGRRRALRRSSLRVWDRGGLLKLRTSPYRPSREGRYGEVRCAPRHRYAGKRRRESGPE